MPLRLLLPCLLLEKFLLLPCLLPCSCFLFVFLFCLGGCLEVSANKRSSGWRPCDLRTTKAPSAYYWVEYLCQFQEASSRGCIHIFEVLRLPGNKKERKAKGGERGGVGGKCFHGNVVESRRHQSRIE